MGAHNILSKCDQALAAFIIAKGAGTATDVFPSKRSADKALPCTICKSFSAKPLPEQPYSGNRMVEALVIVRTFAVAEEEADNEAGVPKTSSDARVSATFDIFNSDLDDSSDKLGEAITAAALAAGVTGFTCFSCEVTEETAGFEGKGDGWYDAVHLSLYCCPGDVA